MKKVHKLLLIFVLVLGIFAISTSYVSAEEIIPEEEIEIPIIEETEEDIPDLEEPNLEENEDEEIPLEPSELAKWIEENIIEVIVGISTSLTTLLIVLFTLYKSVKKFKEMLKGERDDVNLAIKTLRAEIKEEKEKSIKESNALREELVQLNQELKESKEEVVKAYTTFAELKDEVKASKEMLRVGLSNNKDLVRLGIAEEINKIAKKGV
jgi:predicted PurR-regulated permease PerM